MLTIRQFIVATSILAVMLAILMIFLVDASFGTSNEKIAAAIMAVFAATLLVYVIRGKVKEEAVSRVGVLS